MIKRFGLAGVFLSLLLAAGGSARAAEVTLRIHHFVPSTTITHQDYLLPWAEAVEEQSNGRIAVEVYPSMQLGGKPPQLYDQVRDGVVDAIWTLPGYTPGRFPIVSVFELPFMVSDAEATSQAIMEFSKTYLKDEFADVHPILFHVHDRGSFHLNGAPVRRMEDLDGLQIRAPSRAIGDALSALGASPVFMPVPSVPDSLAKGVIDGALIPFEVAYSLKVHELADSHTQIAGPRGLYTAVFLFAMNKDVYETLPDDLKAVIDNNSGLPLAKKIGRLWDNAEARGIAAAEAEGNAFHLIEGAEVERWREATEPVIDAWLADMEERGLDGAAMLAEARRLIEKYSDE